MATNSMRDIKRRIRSVNNMEHITNAMKLVSAAKLRKAKNTLDRTREYLNYVIESIEEIFNNTEEIPSHYLMGSRAINKDCSRTCFIILTSSRGLCGSFNSNVIKEAARQMSACEEKPFVVAIGGKGKEYFEKRGYHICAEYMLPPESISFLETRDISKPIIDLYNAGEIDQVIMIYTSFINTMQQRVKTVRLLPFEIHKDPEYRKLSKQVEYEPSVEEVLNFLGPK